MPIINPLDKEMIATIKSYEVIMNIDRDCEKYIEYFGSQNANENANATMTINADELDVKKENYNRVTTKDMEQFSKKLKIASIYLLKGTQDEKH